MTASGIPSQRTRKQVYDRDGHACIAAQHPLGDDGWYADRYGTCAGIMTLQHRIGRGMGGSKLPGINGVTNLVAMCEHHNGLIERDAAFHRLATACGWSLPRNRRPALVTAEIPVRYIDGCFLLTPDATRAPIPAALAIELWQTFGLIDTIGTLWHGQVA